MARKTSKKPPTKRAARAKAGRAPARSKLTKSARAVSRKPVATKTAPRSAATAKTAPRKTAAVVESKALAPVVLNPPPTKVESGLTKREIAEFREILLERRVQLVGDVTTMRNEALSKNRQDAAGDLSNMPLHMADVGSDNYEQEFTLGLIESERQILREIDDALIRIKAGSFGVCAATGQPIGRARLRATPWANYCYEYVLAQERGRRPRM